MRAAILSIGDELALGQNVDTNSAWLAARLAEAAIIAVEHRTVADDRVAIAKAIADLVSDHDVLLVTGGLGPTADDLTREALGDVLTPNQELVTDQAALEHIQGLFAKRRRDMPEMNRKQALRPATMRCLPNPHGTAPGLTGRLDQTARACQVFAMPGPPREMQPMFVDHVMPAIEQPTGREAEVMLTASVQEFGLGESDAAQRLGNLMERDRNPLVGTTASDAIVSARIRAAGPPRIAQRQLEETVATIERAWHPYAFGRENATLGQSVGRLLRETGMRLATAESCTGGWLGKVIVDEPGASDYYVGGWVSYANELKTKWLGVERELIERFGAVSEQVAEAMARGALDEGGADYSLAITGIAGPGGGTPMKPAGTVFISLGKRAGAGTTVATRRFLFTADRIAVRDRSVKAALQMLRFDLMGVAADMPLLWEMRPGRHAREAASAARAPSGCIPLATGMTTAYIALGSNLGDRAAHLAYALEALRASADVSVAAVSRIIETAPVGAPGQGPYLNAVAELQTCLGARQLLDLCLSIEAARGRVRAAAQRWGPRVLDIDLLLFGDEIIDEPGLRVPHPRMAERAFVLGPMAEIAPTVVHPVLRQDIQTLLARVEADAAREYSPAARCWVH